MKLVKGGVTAALGFKASAVRCGIKKSGRDDLALLFSDVPCICAASFTTNRVKSGSVILSQKRAKKGIASAIMVNSGNANCCVGKREIKDAEALTASVSTELGVKESSVLIASTGIIGRPLAIDKIKKKIGLLKKGLNSSGGAKFARAIMTTDTVPKEIACRFNIGAKSVTLGGAVKGAGMICPDMATMLCFITTDAAITKDALAGALKECVKGSFNRITIDGDMSTNDSVFVLANGMAGNSVIKKGTAGYKEFLGALNFISAQLARKIVLDGEGATKFVEIEVQGAKTAKLAQGIAKHIAKSSLVKTMAAGGDPNWGRVAASAGSSGAKFDSKRMDIYLGNRLAMKNGSRTAVSEKALKNIFGKKEIKITVDLKSGRFSSSAWTCDLTEEYVRINAEYET